MKLTHDFVFFLDKALDMKFKRVRGQDTINGLLYENISDDLRTEIKILLDAAEDKAFEEIWTRWKQVVPREYWKQVLKYLDDDGNVHCPTEEEVGEDLEKSCRIFIRIKMTDIFRSRCQIFIDDQEAPELCYIMYTQKRLQENSVNNLSDLQLNARSFKAGGPRTSIIVVYPTGYTRDDFKYLCFLIDGATHFVYEE